MQLRKQIWKRSRNTSRFTKATDHGYRMKRGGFMSDSEKSAQILSRKNNPQDPINSAV